MTSDNFQKFRVNYLHSSRRFQGELTAALPLTISGRHSGVLSEAQASRVFGETKAAAFEPNRLRVGACVFMLCLAWRTKPERTCLPEGQVRFSEDPTYPRRVARVALLPEQVGVLGHAISLASTDCFFMERCSRQKVDVYEIEQDGCLDQQGPLAVGVEGPGQAAPGGSPLS